MTKLQQLQERKHNTKLRLPVSPEMRSIKKEDDLIDLFPLPRYFQVHFRGVAIFAIAFLGIPAQQAAKITRPLMPSATPVVLLHSLHTQQGVCNIVTQ